MTRPAPFIQKETILQKMPFLLGDKDGSRLCSALDQRFSAAPSLEQGLEAAARSRELVLAVSWSGNSFQLAANRYPVLVGISVRSTQDIDDALRHGARLFEIPSSLEYHRAVTLWRHLGEIS